MYKIDDINGEISLVVYLEDEDKKEYYSCWYYELQELNNLFEIEFENKPSEEEIQDIVRECAIEHAESIVASYSVNSMTMHVQDEDDELVDYEELNLEWKCVSKNLVDITYIDYEGIQYIEY